MGTFVLFSLYKNKFRIQHQLFPGNILMSIRSNMNDRDIELIDITNPEWNCPKPQDFPVDASDTGISTGESILVCVGSEESAEAPGLCYSMEGHTWEELPFEIPMGSEGTESLVLEGDTILLAGGYKSEANTFYDNITAINLSTKEASPFEVSLPLPIAHFIFLKVNETHLFVAGGTNAGFPWSMDVWTYKLGSRNWTKMNPMLEPRAYSYGGLVLRSDGRVEAVLAGGNSVYFTFLSSTEIFDFETLQWRLGPELPKALTFGASVQYGNSFLAVGGMDLQSEQSDRIFKYLPDTEDWEELQRGFITARAFFTALLFSSDLWQCNDPMAGA